MAEQNFLKAIDLWKKTKGEMHEEYGVAHNNLGTLYTDMGDFKQNQYY